MIEGGEIPREIFVFPMPEVEEIFGDAANHPVPI